MSFQSTHDSIRIRISYRDSNQFKPRKTVLVAPSKSPAELIFFREAFKLIDSIRGTTLKRQYTNLIDGYYYGTISWSDISGFRGGYKAAVERVCWLIEDLVRTDDLNSPLPISMLAQYAFKVYSFRTYEVERYEAERGYVDSGHQKACDIWEDAFHALKSLETTVKSKNEAKARKILINRQPAIAPTDPKKVESKAAVVITVAPVPTPIQTPISKVVESDEKEPDPKDVEKTMSIWQKILSCMCGCSIEDEPLYSVVDHSVVTITLSRVNPPPLKWDYLKKQRSDVIESIT